MLSVSGVDLAAEPGRELRDRPASQSAKTPPMIASGTASMMMSGCTNELNWLASTMNSRIEPTTNANIM